MKLEYTSKLFFSKYDHKITLQVKGIAKNWYSVPQSVQHVQEWCRQHVPEHEHKVRCREKEWDPNQNHKTYHVHIYYSDEKVQQQILNQFGARVIAMCTPLDQQHVNDLSVKNIIQVRKQLLYKKYSHVIYFKYQKDSNLKKWLQDYLTDTDAKITKNYQFPTVYLTNTDHMSMLQITWADQIDHVKVVRLLPEV